MNELPACLHCRGLAMYDEKLEDDTKMWRVICSECLISTRWEYSWPRAFYAWNRRSESTPPEPETPEPEVTDYHRSVAALVYDIFEEDQSQPQTEQRYPDEMPDPFSQDDIEHVLAEAGVTDPAVVDIRVTQAVADERDDIWMYAAAQAGAFDAMAKKEDASIVDRVTNGAAAVVWGQVAIAIRARAGEHTETRETE